MFRRGHWTIHASITFLTLLLSFVVLLAGCSSPEPTVLPATPTLPPREATATPGTEVTEGPTGAGVITQIYRPMVPLELLRDETKRRGARAYSPLRPGTSVSIESGDATPVGIYLESEPSNKLEGDKYPIDFFEGTEFFRQEGGDLIRATPRELRIGQHLQVRYPPGRHYELGAVVEVVILERDLASVVPRERPRELFYLSPWEDAHACPGVDEEFAIGFQLNEPMRRAGLVAPTTISLNVDGREVRPRSVWGTVDLPQSHALFYFRGGLGGETALEDRDRLQGPLSPGPHIASLTYPGGNGVRHTYSWTFRVIDSGPCGL